MTEGPMLDAWRSVGERAAAALAPELDLFGDSDVAEFNKSLASATQAMATHPATAAAATTLLAARLAQIPGAALGRWLGSADPAPVPMAERDRRFADPAWKDNPGYYALRLGYESLRRFSEELIEGAGLDRMTTAKARMAADLMLDAAAPTNFLLTNPAALKRAFDTGGMSLLRGAGNFVDDLLHNGGRPRQVDTSPFTLGVNLAATPAKVVYRNDLMELLQYEPRTPQVHAAPLLLSPPWINKYYVMDLAPGRSFVEWAVEHQRSVFAISYRNPGPEMSGVTLDDYLLHGPRQALDVISEITGAQTIDIVGLCLGGALTVIADAFLSDAGDTRVGTLTLLNTMVDYENPGPLGLFTDERTVARLEKQMAKSGSLPGESMAGTFDALRANDLVFNYVVSNWLMGQQPPAFDILAWNADATRMPAAMHSFYLRNFYVQNKLAKGELEVGGRVIRPAAIKQDVYIVSAENDHIVPWQSAYRTTQLVSGPARFVLSSGGHIAGIVNPPGPKAWHLTGENLPAGADDWRSAAVRRAGSWWQDWADWSSAHSGELVDPPPMGSTDHPPLEPGPGRYIHT
jgi:polyhydroxyalkanoate synthase